jgi:inhibitor of cysteine peptidase
VVQREIKKKTSIYGTVAILSAIVLVALIYTFGAVPVIFNPNISPLNTFTSYEELKTFLTTNTKGSYAVYSGGPLDSGFLNSKGIPPVPAPTPVPQAMSSGTYGSGSSAESYSTTNIQVAGVDEADVVKTDGRYLYVIAKNNVYILNADPNDARVLAKIGSNDTYLAGIFLSQDSSRLVVLGSQYTVFYDNGVASIPSPYSYSYFSDDVKTFINVYDISDKANPVLARNFTMSGSYFNSRMIGDYVYAVVSQPAYVANDKVTLPEVYTANAASSVSASGIYYSDVVDNYFAFTTFVGLNIADDAQEPANLTLVTGGASCMYVSLNDIYVTYPQSGGVSIYRVHIDKNNMTFQAEGRVPGDVLNQYSMDEYNGYFRLATTSWTNGPQQNNVYVLNMSLAVVGKLENLASGENLHSARFMGDRCYLVTFKMTDPLFVIDLSEPTNPNVLGALKIPGYSDYLHPYDESHLIGVGKETVEASEGDFAWYQGLKLSLFDVSNVNEPQQLSKYVIGDRGTDSPVLSDPKAFLFDKSSGLLVIPVNLALIDKTTTPPGPSAYGTMVWQGAYVFSVSLDGGFVLRGNVTQLQNNTIAQNGDYYADYSYYWMNSDYWISRALYIGNTLYTVSNARVQLNSLQNFGVIAKIDLP